MNRELKFRAWYAPMSIHEKGCWSYSDSHENSGAMLSIAQADLLVLGHGSVFICQFTGLLDKNKLEIYEGDVIRIKQCECVGHDSEGNEIWKSVEGEVSFEESMFVFSGHSAGTLPLYAYKDDIEVIGNIYQNPELLKS